MKSRKRETRRGDRTIFISSLSPYGDLDTCADLGEKASMLLPSSEGSYLC